MAKKFRMQSKPVKPTRMKSVHDRRALSLYAHNMIGDLIEHLRILFPNPDAIFDLNTESHEIVVDTWRPENDEEFELRMASYKTALAKWEQWAEENKDAIAVREKLDQEQMVKNTEAELKKLKNQVAQTEKLLKKAQLKSC